MSCSFVYIAQSMSLVFSEELYALLDNYAKDAESLNLSIIKGFNRHRLTINNNDQAIYTFVFDDYNDTVNNANEIAKEIRHIQRWSVLNNKLNLILDKMNE